MGLFKESFMKILGDFLVENHIIINNDITFSGAVWQSLGNPTITDIPGLATTSVVVNKDPTNPASATIKLPIPAVAGKLINGEGKQIINTDMLQSYMHTNTIRLNEKGEYNTVNASLYSSDAKTTGIPQDTPYGMAYGNNTFVCVTRRSLQIAYSKDNGQTWFLTYNYPETVMFSHSETVGITFGNGYFYIITDASTMRSSDGVLWEYVSDFKSNTLFYVKYDPSTTRFYFGHVARHQITGYTTDFITVTDVTSTGFPQQNYINGWASGLEVCNTPAYGNTVLQTQNHGTNSPNIKVRRYTGTEWVSFECGIDSFVSFIKYIPTLNKYIIISRGDNNVFKYCVCDTDGSNQQIYDMNYYGGYAQCATIINDVIYVILSTGVIYTNISNLSSPQSWSFVRYSVSSAIPDTYNYTCGDTRVLAEDSNQLVIACSQSIEIFNLNTKTFGTSPTLAFLNGTIRWFMKSNGKFRLVSDLGYSSSDINYPDEFSGKIWDNTGRIIGIGNYDRAQFQTRNDGTILGLTFNEVAIPGLLSNAGISLFNNLRDYGASLGNTNAIMMNLWANTPTDDYGASVNPETPVKTPTLNPEGGYSLWPLTLHLTEGGNTLFLNAYVWDNGLQPDPRGRYKVGYYCANPTNARIQDPSAWTQVGLNCRSGDCVQRVMTTFATSSYVDGGLFSVEKRYDSILYCVSSTHGGRLWDGYSYVDRGFQNDTRISNAATNNTGTLALFTYTKIKNGILGFTIDNASMATGNANGAVATTCNSAGIPNNAQINGVYYSTNLGKWIIMLNGGYILTSPTGASESWTKIRTPFPNAVVTATDMPNGKVLFSGSDGQALMTADGVTFDGAYIQPSYTFSKQAGIGMYRAGDNILGFATNGIYRTSVQKDGQLRHESDLNIYGDVHATGNAVSVSNVSALSDRKIKDNITIIHDALQRVLQLNGYSYLNTKTGKMDFGLLATEVEKVFPEAIVIDPDGTKRVLYMNLIAPILQAIQQQQEQIKNL